MKKAAKIAIIVYSVIGAVLIFPLVVGILACKKLKTATCREEVTVMGILTLLFCGLVAGILMLCIPDEEFEEIPEA